MPRATVESKPARRAPQSARPAPSPPRRYRCPENGCPWSYNRDADRFRHSFTHMLPEERETHMIYCSYSGCGHKTLQRSNMRTHARTHTGEKPEVCPDCNYCTADPGSLTLHRKQKHGYEPRETATKAYKRVRPDIDVIASPPSPAVSSFSSSDASSNAAPSYSALSLESWSTQPSFATPPSSADSSFGDDSDYSSSASSDHFAYVSLAQTSSASYAWPQDVALDAASVDRFSEFFTPTPRPGPSALHPAANVQQFFHSTAEGQLLTDDELAELLAIGEVTGNSSLWTPFAYSPAPAAPFFHSQPPSHDEVFSAEWIGVAHM
ncbi:hypothetical protein B0H17DRAFT_1143157 [Mycena rosella]|uniref:C2H2-type domain-containing protein n=1 Tax=Mycena rosella TaxID=1033263 RepID=A0AAD7CVN6_MYCRO|nr:hypothetical protein B0H17DRAFT_1143157 [Mycena rosella]